MKLRGRAGGRRPSSGRFCSLSVHDERTLRGDTPPRLCTVCVAQKDSCLIFINTQSLNFNHLKKIKRQKKEQEKERKIDFRLKALPKFSLGQNLILNINKLLEMRSPFFASNI